MAGNATSDNIGPLNLINIKRVAMVIRRAEDAFETGSGGQDAKPEVGTAVARFLAQRGLSGPSTWPATALVDRFLNSRTAVTSPPPAPSSGGCPVPPPAAPPPAPPEPRIAISDFVCEADVRVAMNANRKIHIGPRTIVTPAARELANQHDILVTAQRS